MGAHGTMASVACIFMQAIVFRERAHMPPIGRGEDSRAARPTSPDTDDQANVITDRRQLQAT
jgi:hypothetical protein